MTSEKASPSLNCFAGEASERSGLKGKGLSPVKELVNFRTAVSVLSFIYPVVGSLELRHVCSAASSEANQGRFRRLRLEWMDGWLP